MPSQVITIKLDNLQFYSFHGLYPEEKVIGGDFYVNLEASFSIQGVNAEIEPLTEIDQTVDYASIFNIVSRIMSTPRELLETVAM